MVILVYSSDIAGCSGNAGSSGASGSGGNTIS